jgi:putative SOS response-associated peptidase YedK
MPVILEEGDFEPWLRKGGTTFLKPTANELLQKWPVSKRVNSSRAPNDDASLIDAI